MNFNTDTLDTLDLNQQIAKLEETNRSKFVSEMISGKHKTSDNSYDFDMASWENTLSDVKVLLLTPGISINKRYKSKLNIEKGNIHPLGIGLLGTILKKAGCNVKILDLAVELLSDEEILERVDNFKPIMIGVSCWSPTANEAIYLSELIKTKYEIPMVYGGPHITSFPAAVIKRHKTIDIVAFGEGETTILELAQHFSYGKPALNEINGIGYRDLNGKTVFTKSRPRVRNLDQIPILSREIYKSGVYTPLPNNYKRLPAVNMVTSRGCPYKCTFCFQAGRFGLKFRNQSVERVIEEIKYLQRDFGVQEINFWDDIFLVNKKWIYRFCDALDKENIDITWTCESRVDHVNPDLLKRIASVGCYCIFYGFEAGTNNLLDSIKKGTTIEQNRQAAIWTAEAGIVMRASFILGIPGETPETGQETIDFALSLPNLDSLQFSFATPFPGTAMFDELMHQKEYDEEEYIRDLYRYTSWEITYITEGYKGKEDLLLEMRKKAYRSFYFNPGYIWRQLKNINSLEDVDRLLSGAKLALGISF